MFRSTPYALHAALLFSSLLFGSVSALAQKLPLQGVPSVNLGLPAPNLPIVQPRLPPLEATVRVPSVGGLTPPLNATLNVGGSGPGAPPVPEIPSAAALQDQLAEKRLDLLPTCR